MPGYWIIRGTVKDKEAFETYASQWLPIAEEYGARYLTTSGRHETREVADYDSVVIVKFPSYEVARTCYDSAEYQQLLEFAYRAYDREVTIVDAGGKFEPLS